jgi:hypothetical protein
MSLRIRQIVLAARELEPVVEHLQSVLGAPVCYRDPEVAKFGLQNALFLIGDQFLEVVSPTQPNTTAGRHLDKHGDSGYMLILQTDDLARERARLDRLGVRIVWQATHDEIAAVHLHPKDIGGAIVSLDQATPPESWRWAGPNWQSMATSKGAQRVLGVSMSAIDPQKLLTRWREVLGVPADTSPNHAAAITIDGGAIRFEAGARDLMVEFAMAVPQLQLALSAARARGLPVIDNIVTICGTRFRLQ